MILLFAIIFQRYEQRFIYLAYRVNKFNIPYWNEVFPYRWFNVDNTIHKTGTSSPCLYLLNDRLDHAMNTLTFYIYLQVESMHSRI